MQDISSSRAVTPMMAQWHACKAKAPEVILFFRLGDFYEAFYEDAELLAKELDLTLTKRQEIPMAGVPHHICDTYIDRLVAKGYRVALAEQLDDPKITKGIMRREIVRMITPGSVIHQSSLLQDKEQNFLCSIVSSNKVFGLGLLDITTSDFRVMELEGKNALFDELVRIRPKEILVSKKWKEKEVEFLKLLEPFFRPSLYALDPLAFDPEHALNRLTKQFKVHSLDVFGLKGMSVAISAAGALLSYAQEELKIPLKQLTSLKVERSSDCMQIDKNTQRNLELTVPLNQGQKEACLLHLIDETKTPMGGRRLRYMLLHPLLSVEKIQERQEAVAELMRDFSSLLQLRKYLAEVRDLERLLMRIETGFCGPRDCLSLCSSLEQVPLIAAFLSSCFSSLLKTHLDALVDMHPLTEHIKKAIEPEAPLRLGGGTTFKKGYHPILDGLLQIKKEGGDWTLRYQHTLRENLHIKTLKVSYTKAFGYYIEVSKGQVDKVPSSFHRRQTLVNADRFTTEELKNFEYQSLSADEKISALEDELFEELKQKIIEQSSSIAAIAKALSYIDCFSALSLVALERNFICPKIDTSTTFDVSGMRHPTIESLSKEPFIPNDLFLNGQEKQLALITGPNMAGKSTFIRQAALLVILAQMGSFVPSKSAHIGIVDKVFSRIGASDDLSRGQSTFMVEMTETAHILQNATSHSLVILDEIGRGTSTYDGISIAWAVAKYLLTTSGKQAKTLFATHYFEMTELPSFFPAAFNLSMAIEETSHGIVFLRKVVPYAADKSYGIHVAKLAGIPSSVLVEAEKKLSTLEKSLKASPPEKKPEQLDLFSPPALAPLPHPLVSELKTLNLDATTPLQALQLLSNWKKMLSI